jgi:hypothetical protein
MECAVHAVERAACECSTGLCLVYPVQRINSFIVHWAFAIVTTEMLEGWQSHRESRRAGIYMQERYGGYRCEGDQATATRRHKRYSPTGTRKGAKETRTTERGEDTVTVKDA